MIDYDKIIKNSSELIIRNITDSNDRAILSLNIINSLPKLIAPVIMKVYNYESDELNDSIEVAVSYISKIPKYHFIVKFYNLIEVNVKSFFINHESSEHLLFIYFDYLIKIKDMLSNDFNLNILSNIFDCLRMFNDEYTSYYDEVSNKLNFTLSNAVKSSAYKDLYYIREKKPKFTVNGKIYEYTISPANDYASKFNTSIVYSLYDIPSHYSLRLNFIDDTIVVDGNTINIKIIGEYLVSIREAEFKNFSKLLNKGSYNNSAEFTNLMSF